MINKFEIKSHDGPGRIGKLNGEKTPKLFYKTDLKIAPSEGSAYNIEKEIARFNIEETLKLAEENVEKCDAAVIQGSKYIDLRIKCLKQMNAHPSSMLIFTFAESSFMPILTYMGIDGFLTDASNYYSYLNVLQTPTKAYDLNIYKIYDEITQKELEEKNIECLDFVIREIQTHMENHSLRNLIEERSTTSPQNIATLKLLDKKYMDFILEHNQLF